MSAAGSLIGMLLGVVAVAASSGGKSELRIVYNASDSAPRGWYAVLPPSDLRVGDYVVARLPHKVATLAASRGYLPASVPVLKQIAAVRGQRVCVQGGVVRIDDTAVARVLNADLRQRPLAAWSHCRWLVDGELFLLNATVLESFDSRYFGPIDVSFVRGRAVPLATLFQ